jgi:hypothetical protein
MTTDKIMLMEFVLNSHTGPLFQAAHARAQRLEAKEIGDWIFFDTLPLAIRDRVVSAFCRSTNSDEYDGWAKCIYPYINSFTKDELRSILTSSLEKLKIRDSYELARIALSIRKTEGASQGLEAPLEAVTKVLNDYLT